MRHVTSESDVKSTTTKGGRYQFASLPAGTYRVLVRDEKKANAAEVLANGLSITLTEHGEAVLDLVAP